MMFMFEIPAHAREILGMLDPLIDISQSSGESEGVVFFAAEDEVVVERVLTSMGVPFNKLDDGGTGDRWIENTRVRYDHHGVIESSITADDAVEELSNLFDLLHESPDAALAALQEAARHYGRDGARTCRSLSESQPSERLAALLGHARSADGSAQTA